MADKNSYEQKTLADGSKNPKYIDMLEEDKPIANQKFACISFVSPEKNTKGSGALFISRISKNVGFSQVHGKIQSVS